MMEVFIAAAVLYALGWVYLRRKDRRRRGSNERSLTTTTDSDKSASRWTDYYTRQDHP